MTALTRDPAAGERRAARREALRGLAWALPGLLWIGAFFLVPLGVMALYSLARRGAGGVVWELGLDNYLRFFGQGALIQALWVSLEIALLTTVISVLLAYPLAWILACRVPRRWQRLALILAVLPFWTSYVVRSYSWLLVLAPTGVVNQTLLTLGLVDEPLRLAYTSGATVLGFVHFFTMLVTLTVFASLVQINPRYRLAAADLGASSWRTFVHVTLPLSLPGVVVGAFLTFLICIGDYITPQILGGNRELTMPQAILFQVQRRSNFPMASAMALVLMALVVEPEVLLDEPLGAARVLDVAFQGSFLRVRTGSLAEGGPELLLKLPAGTALEPGASVDIWTRAGDLTPVA